MALPEMKSESPVEAMLALTKRANSDVQPALGHLINSATLAWIKKLSDLRYGTLCAILSRSAVDLIFFNSAVINSRSLRLNHHHPSRWYDIVVMYEPA